DLPLLRIDPEDLVAALVIEQRRVRILRLHALPAFRDVVAVAAGCDGRGDVLRGHRRACQVVRAGWHDAGVVLVDIAGRHDDVALAVLGDPFDDALPRLRVAAPGIGVERTGRPGRRVREGHHHHLLGQQVPARVAGQPLGQPALLGRTDHLFDAAFVAGAAGTLPRQQGGVAALLAAVLAGVQHVHAQQVAVI